jgi:hypothetical protein
MFIISQVVLHKGQFCQTTSIPSYSIAIGLVVYAAVYLYFLFQQEQYLDFFNQFAIYVVGLDLLLSALYFVHVSKTEAAQFLADTDADADTKGEPDTFADADADADADTDADTDADLQNKLDKIHAGEASDICTDADVSDISDTDSVDTLDSVDSVESQNTEEFIRSIDVVQPPLDDNLADADLADVDITDADLADINDAGIEADTDLADLADTDAEIPDADIEADTGAKIENVLTLQKLAELQNQLQLQVEPDLVQPKKRRGRPAKMDL